MEQTAAKIMVRAVAILYMALILNGSITSPDQIPGKVDKWDYQCLAGTIMCENPYGTELKSDHLHSRQMSGHLHM